MHIPHHTPKMKNFQWRPTPLELFMTFVPPELMNSVKLGM